MHDWEKITFLLCIIVGLLAFAAGFALGSDVARDLHAAVGFRHDNQVYRCEAE